MPATRLPHARALVAALSASLFLVGCQELDVTNPNAPDRRRATAQPEDVQALIASSFPTWWDVAAGTQPGFPLSTMADAFTSGFADFGILAMSSEPRVAYDNSPTNNRRFANETPWYELYGVLSNVNDGLAAIEGGVTITEGATDVTPRARAFGKFMQGVTLGYIALIFDQAYYADENSTPEQLGEPQLVPYPEIRDSALARLAEAAEIAGANSFTLPAAGWVNGLALTNTQVAQLARTFAARFLAYSARTPEERQAVDWNRVLSLLDGAITEDFAPIGLTEVIFSDLRRVAARERPNRPPGDFSRVDYWLVGFADTTGRFQNWAAAPLADRTPFQLATPDRRVHGSAGPSSSGRYLGYTASTVYAADRGLYHRSFYWWLRYGRGNSWQEGPQVLLTVDELRLLRAEGLIRLGRAAEAVPLVNATRTAHGELPPVTADGPPNDGSCVPRKLDGSCGGLWHALVWEKRIETLGVDVNVSFWDARGWGRLPEGTPVHLPVPGREIDATGLTPYTLGGIGGEGGAPAPRYDACPVALARC